MSLVLMF